jgi:hypothetical protein
MVAGGLAVSFFNRARTTNDINFVLQIYPAHVKAWTRKLNIKTYGLLE